jgi:hypothetical protein
LTGPAKPRRWWARGVMLVVLLAGAVGGGVWWHSHSSQRAIDAALAELDAADPGWRFNDLIGGRKKPRDQDNAALTLLTATAKLRVTPIQDLPNYDTVMKPWRPPAALSHLQREFLRVELAKAAAGLALLRQVKDQPEGSFPLKLMPDALGTLVPHIQDLITEVEWLRHDAMLRASEESVTAGLESCQAQLNAIWAHADQPFLIAGLHRAGRFIVCARTVEFCLSQGETTPEMLTTLQTLANREISDAEYLYLMRGNRSGMVEYLLNYDQTKSTLHAMKTSSFVKVAAPTWRDRFYDYFPQSVAADIPGFLCYSNRLVEAAKAPLHEQHAAVAAVEADLPNQSPITQTLSAGLARIVKSTLRGQAAKRTLFVALACERYRMQHAKWPDTLDQLVEAKLLDAIPADPYDGKPLRLARFQGGIVIYSLGDDREDNHGTIDFDNLATPGTDLGFRLWDRPRRKGGTP